MIRSRRLLIALAAAAAVAAHSPPADAHRGSWAFDMGTYSTAHDDVDFLFHTSVPTGRWRTRIANGSREWNRFGRRLQFHPPSSSTPSATTSPTVGCPNSDTRRPSIVFRAQLNGDIAGALAVNYTCSGPDGPFYFRMFFNTRIDQWWGDPNDDRKIPSSHFDIQSVATHEFGHAAGWGPHYDDDGPDEGERKDYKSYCRVALRQNEPASSGENRPYLQHRDQDDLNKEQQTMCSYVPSGSVHQRGLAFHDRGTFRNAYP